MTPRAIATGNTMVLKPSPVTPMTSMRMVELLYQAGLPKGVVNLVTCGDVESEHLVKHPDVKGIIFVGSTAVGRHVYSTASAHGKRVQALCQAKNHALVLEDAALERTARSIINGGLGCAGERCMALPVVVAQESIADELTALLVKFAKERKIGPAHDRTSELGPVVTEKHRKSVSGWIEKGGAEGAQISLDGRGVVVKGYENGFYLGPTIFDHVKSGMSIGEEEVFGPVIFVKRVQNFDRRPGDDELEPVRQWFRHLHAERVHFSREFVKKSHAGMVGVVTSGFRCRSRCSPCLPQVLVPG